MTEFTKISWVCGCIDEARKVARYLVQERLVANAEIIPWIESIVMWNNQLETYQETKVIFKTRKNLIEKVTRVILENSSYQVPEIIYTQIEEGNAPYLTWMDDSIRDYSELPSS